MFQYISFFLGIIIFFVFVYVAIVSFTEKQKRAAYVSLLCSLILSAPFILAAILNIEILSISLIAITIIILLLLIIPVGKKKFQDRGKPNSKIDERNIVFSRRLLKKEVKDLKNIIKKIQLTVKLTKNSEANPD